jgi:acyl-CoA synthetase (AMP-forming)/AMP-acid ligase II
VNFAALLDFHARSDPDALALVDDPTGRNWSWAELLDAVIGAQRGLAGIGIEPGDRLGLATYNRPEFVILLLAALRGGVIPALFNVRWGETELGLAIEDCAPKAVLAEPTLAESVVDRAIADRDCRLLVVPEDGAAWASGDLADILLPGEDAATPPVGRGDEDLAEIMYTSGSTGRPKGVLLHHGLHFANALSLQERLLLKRQDVGLVVCPLFHLSGRVVWEMAMGAGGPLVIGRRWRKDEFARLLREHRVTYTHIITNAINELAKDEEVDAGDTLRVTLFGGGQTAEQQAVSYEQRFGGVLCSGYGRSEGGYSWELPDRAVRQINRNGLPLAGTAEIRVVDPDGVAVEAGRAGEIRMRGDGVARGYWERPDLDADAFDEAGFMRTGDVGTFDRDGYLTFEGRIDRMIKTGGENVHPTEVEEVLLRMPAVVAAAVVGMDDERLSERITAAVVVRDAGTDGPLIDDWCREHLTGFKRPRQVVLFDEMPELGSGKIDFRAVKEMLERADQVGADEVDSNQQKEMR